MNIVPETRQDQQDIEHLLDLAFGPSRWGKTVYRLRHGVRPVRALNTVIREDGVLKGSLRFWPIVIGPDRVPALLLGPVAVLPSDRGKGYARALIWNGLEEGKRLGYGIVLLVGDEPYYAKSGFRKIPKGQVKMPGPVDPGRLLVHELTPGVFDANVKGMIRPDWAVEKLTS